jgi:hypothetical protein
MSYVKVYRVTQKMHAPSVVPASCWSHIFSRWGSLCALVNGGKAKLVAA